MSYLFVLGHIYLCGVREAEGIEMVCQEYCHCATKHSTARLTFSTCHRAVRPLTCAMVMALAEVHLSKAVGNGCVF